ncbi:Nuclear cap-binding protein subunit 1 [Nowakowskiella sp. JEL0407]|nr:Nuclear cap-binding protein subunit 1 [Nowakowskiella sp. JEL0407]
MSNYRNERTYYRPPREHKPIRIDDANLNLDQVVKQLFIKCGDSGDIPTTIQQLIKAIERENRSEIICHAMMDCTLQIPHKTEIYATAACLLNANDFDLGSAICKATHKALSDALTNSNFLSVKLLLRFIAIMANGQFFPTNTLIRLFSVFLNEITKTQSTARKTTFVYLVMITLPYCGEILYDKERSEFAKLFSQIQQFVTTTDFKTCYAMQYYPTKIATENIKQFYSLLVSLANREWICEFLSFPLKSFTTALGAALTQTLPDVVIPDESKGVSYPFQIPRLEIFTPEIMEIEKLRVHAGTGIERVIISDIVHDLLELYSHNHVELVARYFAVDSEIPTFARGFNKDVVKQVNVMGNVIEVLFERLFTRKESKTVLYIVNVISALIKEKPTLSVFARAIRILFLRLDGYEVNKETTADTTGDSDIKVEPIAGVAGLDPAIVIKFAEFIGVYAGQVGFNLPWPKWVDVIAQYPTVEQEIQEKQYSASVVSQGVYLFAKHVIDLEIRSSYYERVVETLPLRIKLNEGLCPQQPPKCNPMLVEDVGEDGVERRQKYSLLIENIKGCVLQRRGVDVLREIIGNDDMEVDGDEERMDVVREIVLESVLFGGMKSFSHTLNGIERYLNVLQELCSQSIPAQLSTIAIIARFWKYNNLFVEILLDKFINYRILETISVVMWCCSDGLENGFRFSTWTILKSTLQKIENKQQHLTKMKHTLQSEIDSSADTEDSMVDEFGRVRIGKDSELRKKLASVENGVVTVAEEKKKVYLEIFKSLSKYLTDKIYLERGNNVDVLQTGWWRWIAGLMREIGKTFKKEISEMTITLDTIVFDSPDIDERVKNIWEDLKVYYERRI